MFLKQSIWFYLLLFILGCNKINNQEISVTGCILDESTDKPINGAKVTVLCWYDAGWNKTDYVSIDTVTNGNGLFDVKIKKGYKVIIASIAPAYNVSVYEKSKISSRIIKAKLKLNKIKSDKSGFVDVLYDGNLKEYIVQNTSN